MSFAELKPQLDRLPPEEMLKAFAYLKHLLRAESPANQADLARRHVDLDEGKGIPFDEVKRRLGLK